MCFTALADFTMKNVVRFKADDENVSKNGWCKKDKTEADIEMLKMISHSYDISDEKYIEPIVKLLHCIADRV